MSDSWGWEVSTSLRVQLVVNIGFRCFQLGSSKLEHLQFRISPCPGLPQPAAFRNPRFFGAGCTNVSRGKLRKSTMIYRAPECQLWWLRKFSASPTAAGPWDSIQTVQWKTWTNSHVFRRSQTSAEARSKRSAFSKQPSVPEHKPSGWNARHPRQGQDGHVCGIQTYIEVSLPNPKIQWEAHAQKNCTTLTIWTHLYRNCHWRPHSFGPLFALQLKALIPFSSNKALSSWEKLCHSCLPKKYNKMTIWIGKYGKMLENEDQHWSIMIKHWICGGIP